MIASILISASPLIQKFIIIGHQIITKTETIHEEKIGHSKSLPFYVGV